MAKIEKQKKESKEKIYNLPNALSLFRLLVSPILVLLIFQGINIWLLAILFAISALTDFADGFIARRFNRVTNLGRKLDIIADRVLMISIILAILTYLVETQLITTSHILLIVLIISREILALPFFIIAIVVGKRFLPHARFAGKLMTTMQGVTFPMIILNWWIAWPFAIVTSIIGIICAGYYAYDALIKPNNKYQKDLDKHYAELVKKI
ncbi:MAG: CDP-alcohol phosphatidyltransferase family protein [Nanoarchaeota archaeon]